MPLPNISGLSDPMNYNTPYDYQEDLNQAPRVPPLDIPGALANTSNLKYRPSTMVGSTGDVPIPAHYRDEVGNIYPIMPPTTTIDTGETLAERQARLAQSATMTPELKPIQQILTEKGAKYSDPVDYLNDVKSHAYELARAQGIDINQPDGQQWMQQTLTAAKQAMPEYVVPTTKDDVMNIDGMLYDIKHKKVLYDPFNPQGSQQPDQMGQPPQVPGLPQSAGPETPEDPRKRLYEQDKAFVSQYAGNPRVQQNPRFKDAVKRMDDYEKEQRSIAKDATPNISQKITAGHEIRSTYDDLPSKVDLFGKGQMMGSDQLKNRLDAVLKPVNGDFSKLNPQAKQTFVFAMNKLRDPTSATLLAEAQEIANKTGFGDQALAFFMNMKKGDPVPDQVAQDIYNVISQVHDSHREKLINDLMPLKEDLDGIGKKFTSIGVPKDIQDEIEKRIKNPVDGADPITQKFMSKGAKAGDTGTIGGVKYVFDGTTAKPVK